MKNYLLLLSVLLVTLFEISCDRMAVYDKNKPVPDYTWNYKDTFLFHVNIADTVHAHNIYINIRNSENYRYSNIYLFITTYAPNGNFLKDTFEITLADKSGKWLGQGAGNIFSLQVPYKKNVRFPYRGIYLFEIQHAMWNKDLHGIADVGIRVEKEK